jgi:hypothetical protein
MADLERRRKRTHRVWAAAGLVLAVGVAAALVLGRGPDATDPAATPGPTGAAVGSPTASDGVVPGPPTTTAAPAVPGEGTYLGTFINRLDVNSGGSLSVVLRDLPALTERTGRNPAIVASYQPWADRWVRNENLAAVANTYGAVPMVSWGCDPPNDLVASGAEDEVIRRFAEQLRAYGRPVLLRWLWEPNLFVAERCLGPGGVPEQAARYVAAFRHIVDVFRVTGTTNVAFVWTPSAGALAAPMEPYYPGDEYVDWIGVDGYDWPDGRGNFVEVFDDWYQSFAPRGKPMIVAETGATEDQPQFLAEIADVVPSRYPAIKAVVYFDAVGNVDWRLSSYGGSGLDAFSSLGRDPDFTVMPPGER